MTDFFDLSKMKDFADSKLKIIKIMISLCYRVENTVRKGENADYLHFLLFPTVFSKAFLFRVVESRGKELTLTSIYTHFNTLKKKSFGKTLWKKVKLLKMSNFTCFPNVFFPICILKSFNSHISVVVCSFFEFGTVWKWCIGEWVNPFPHNDTF